VRRRLGSDDQAGEGGLGQDVRAFSLRQDAESKTPAEPSFPRTARAPQPSPASPPRQEHLRRHTAAHLLSRKSAKNYNACMPSAAPTDIAIFRPLGETSFAQAEQTVADAIALTREQGGRELMIVTTGLTGFAAPDLAARHRMVRRWAEAAQGRVTIAIVVPPHFIDEQKFGVVAARNFGLRGDVFTDEGEAADWLRLHR
jgi:hypothetical protein